MQRQPMQQQQLQKEQLPQQQQQMVQIVYTSQQQQHQTQRAPGTQIYQLVSPGATVGGSSRLPAQQQQVRILNSSGQAGLMLQQRAVVLAATPQPQLQQQVRIIRAPPARLPTAVVGHLQPAVSSSSVGGAAVGSVNKSSSLASGQDNKPLLTHSWPQQQPPVISLQAPSVHRQQQLPAASDLAARGMTAASSRPGMMTAGSMRPAVMMTPGGVSTSRVVTAGSVMPTAHQLAPRSVRYNDYKVI
jgi:hypothetical protein